MDRRRGLGATQTRFADGIARRHKPDYLILLISALLLTIGLVVVYSISPGLSASRHISQSYFVTKQLVDVGLGIVAFIIASALPLKFWSRAAKPLAAAAVAGSVAVMLLPTDEIYQAHRWIRFAGLSFQVAELIKLAILIGLASFLAVRYRQGRIADTNSTLRPLIILLAIIGLVVAKFQSDLGSAAVMVMMVFLMAYVAGIPLKRVAIIGGLILVLMTIMISSSAYRRERLATFLHPEQDCLSVGYQACQALISVGSGGTLGLGLGNSVQAYGYLPEASNDSIFAIMAEKFGFVGSVIILVLYGVLITRLKGVAERTADIFPRLLVVGVTAWLSVQMIINVGAMVGILPLKGITLPLISQGGTSLIFLAAAVGLVFQISRYTSYSVTEPGPAPANDKFTANNNTYGRGIRRPHNPTLVTRPRT